MKKTALSILIIAGVLVISVLLFYRTRISSAYSIEKVSNYPDYNIYSMDIDYDYDLDRLLEKDNAGDEKYINNVIDEVLPGIPVKIKTPDFACSAFNMLNTEDGHYIMGRNYDFKTNTSAMLVRCNPKDGYRSIGLSALDNIQANNADSTILTRFASLAAPFCCLDGINEEGLAISVLMLDSEPTKQNTGKPTLTTCLAVRLILDRAATTEEAINILNSYDMFSNANKDYHFYINDATGDARIIEYDLWDKGRKLVATPTDLVTNFFIMYKDSVSQVEDKGIYGHGRIRYNKMDSVFTEHKDALTSGIGWEALKAASMKPRPEKPSCTQWSALYDNTARNLAVVFHTDWDTTFFFDIDEQ